jgi:8-oxo-dGTP pyrophosphatase MutT (NUDIX family)
MLRFVVTRSLGPFTFWATPGGEIEDGESDHAAAQRELREELGIAVELIGPVHTATARFEHAGETVSATDTFFVGRCTHEAPKLRAFTEEERSVLKEMRWWTLSELRTTDGTIFPPDLARVVEQALRR